MFSGVAGPNMKKMLVFRKIVKLFQLSLRADVTSQQRKKTTKKAWLTDCKGCGKQVDGT